MELQAEMIGRLLPSIGSGLDDRGLEASRLRAGRVSDRLGLIAGFGFDRELICGSTRSGS